MWEKGKEGKWEEKGILKCCCSMNNNGGGYNGTSLFIWASAPCILLQNEVYIFIVLQQKSGGHGQRIIFLFGEEKAQEIGNGSHLEKILDIRMCHAVFRKMGEDGGKECESRDGTVVVIFQE